MKIIFYFCKVKCKVHNMHYIDVQLFTIKSVHLSLRYTLFIQEVLGYSTGEYLIARSMKQGKSNCMKLQIE